MDKNEQFNEIIENVKSGMEKISILLNNPFFKGFNVNSIPKYEKEDMEFMKLLFNQCGIELRSDDKFTAMTLSAIATIDIGGIMKVADNLEADSAYRKKQLENMDSLLQHPIVKCLIENDKTLPYYKKITDEHNQKEAITAYAYIKIFVEYLRKIINAYDEIKDDFENILKDDLKKMYKTDIKK